MEEKQAIVGVLMVLVVAVTGYLILNQGSTGAAVEYRSCCCNILAGPEFDGRTLVRSQVQMFANDCKEACTRYADQGAVFPQDGLCAENP